MRSDGDRTILIVEDNPDDRLLIERAFRKAGRDRGLQHVDDGEKALAYLEGSGDYADRTRHPLPALILLDLKLPRKSGREVLEWVRTRPQTRHIPVVVFSSSRESVDILGAYALGANSYLVKPTDDAGLQEVVRTLDAYWMGLNVTSR